MYKQRRRAAFYLLNFLAGIIFVVLTLLLIPTDNFRIIAIVTGIMFSITMYVCTTIYGRISRRMEDRTMHTHETGIINTFLDDLRFSYTEDEFIQVVQKDLEDLADASVLYVDRETNYIMYNSSTRITSSVDTATKLEQNFPKTWAEGVFFLDEELGVISNPRDARGFFLVSGTKHLYVFCRIAHEIDDLMYSRLLEEFKRYEKRSVVISELTEISSLSAEWDQLAATQRSFLPQKMPEVKGLDIAAYFRPLVNVSGDYYNVLPIDEHKTMIMLGDVSGKGLSAALVMGLVMNTVKIIENKEDLEGVVKAVDRAIKGMHLQDKYTVLFIGIVDTEHMTIRYVNASMSDPIVVTRSPDGYRIKPLTSNNSVVGIIDMEDIKVSERRLFRDDLILMASDGVSEVMDENGVELGDTQLYVNTIKNSAYKSARHLINDIVDLVMSYNGDKKLRDDVTILAVKVEG